MRRGCLAVEILVVSCLIAGCDDGGTATMSPEEARSAIDATKKWQEGHSRPVAGTQGGSSPADVARKKWLPHKP